MNFQKKFHLNKFKRIKNWKNPDFLRVLLAGDRDIWLWTSEKISPKQFLGMMRNKKILKIRRFARNFAHFGVRPHKENNVRKAKIWNGMKEKSFGIYLFHQQIIYLTIIPLNGKVTPIVQVIISFLCAVGLASIITAVLKKFKLTRVLYGVWYLAMMSQP